MALVATACGGAGTTTTTEASGALVIYSGRSEELVAPVIESFETDTGIDVEIRYGSSSEMAATINVEGSLSPADVFYAQDPATIGSVRTLLAPLPESVLSLVPERFRDPDGYWTGITARSRVLAYNPELVSADELPGPAGSASPPPMDRF
jgi:iron(III) transport system substrate-binding protein